MPSTPPDIGQPTREARTGREDRGQRGNKWWTLVAVCLGTFMLLLDSSIVNVTAGAGGIKVNDQNPPGARCRIEDRHRRGLVRRVGGKRPGVPGGITAAAVLRDPDVRSARDRGRDRMPGGLRGGAREAVRTARARCRDTRRVARWQC